MTSPERQEPLPFSAALVPFPVERNLPGLPAPAEVRSALTEQFHAAVAREREQRGTVHQPADVWPMVRAVQGFRDLVDDYARALKGVSDTAKAVLEDELFAANGESDGIPNGPLRVPHDGHIVSVKPKTDNEYDIDSEQVLACLAALVAKSWRRDQLVQQAPSMAEDPEGFAIAVARRALEMVGAATLKVSHVRALAAELGHAGEDSLSQTVSDAIRKRRVYKGVTVERSEDKRHRPFLGREAS